MLKARTGDRNSARKYMHEEEPVLGPVEGISKVAMRKTLRSREENPKFELQSLCFI